MPSSLIRRGTPVVISAPSGAGKTTLCHRVAKLLERVHFSISYTTRPARGDEKDGVDYHFLSDQAFDDMVSKQQFLEHASVHGNKYGSGLEVTENALAAGNDVLFDIDVQGGEQIAKRLEDTVLVYVLPPSMKVLEERLRARGTDNDDVIASRLAAARAEINAATGLYTHWIVNDELESATDAFRSILVAERTRRVDVAALVSGL